MLLARPEGVTQGAGSGSGTLDFSTEDHWFRWTALVVIGRVAYLMWHYDFASSMIWFVKLVTDPFTDIVAYFPRRAQRA